MQTRFRDSGFQRKAHFQKLRLRSQNTHAANNGVQIVFQNFFSTNAAETAKHFITVQEQTSETMIKIFIC